MLHHSPGKKDKPKKEKPKKEDKKAKKGMMEQMDRARWTPEVGLSEGGNWWGPGADPSGLPASDRRPCETAGLG